MNWIFIGLLAGNLVTSGHETREACEGRAVIAREAKVERATCFQLPTGNLMLTGSGTYISTCGNGICQHR